MPRKFRVWKDNGEDLGFAISCLMTGAVTFDEFKEWLYIVIENTDNLPGYIFDILDIKERFDFKPSMTIGFIPHWAHVDRELDAIEAIAYKRRADYTSDAVNQDDALNALAENPHIERRFYEIFSFIEPDV